MKVLYNEITSSVLNNGYISQPFCLHRGVRQGCPLSPYLFIIAVEMLAIKVRGNEDLTGLSIFGKSTKIPQFADDTDLPFTPTLASFFALLKDLESFSCISVLTLNFEKKIWCYL